MPVTSTKVATNGLDAMPGSTPKRLKMSGNIEPTRVPQTQMDATAKAMTSASRQRSTGSRGSEHFDGKVYFNWPDVSISGSGSDTPSGSKTVASAVVVMICAVFGGRTTWTSVSSFE